MAAAMLATALAAACNGCGAAPQERPPPAQPCGGDIFARAIAGRIIDGRTFVLDDGREVRLAAVEVPPLPPAREPGGSDAKEALDAFVGGEEIVLRRAEAPTDRYGRLIAFVGTIRDGEELFAQGELIAGGFGRVADRVGSRGCAADLIGRENAARKAKLGLWADPYYAVLDAGHPADVLAQRGRFALVEGKVVSVRQSGATIYMNFGRHWSEGFTVTILKRNERSFATAGLDAKRLEGRRVRVRGFVEARDGTAGGPWIEAARPEQIEPVDRE